MSYVPAIGDALARAAVQETSRRAINASGMDVDLRDVLFNGLKRVARPYVQKDSLNKLRASAKRIAERSFMNTAYISPDSYARIAAKKRIRGKRYSKIPRTIVSSNRREANFTDLGTQTFTVASDLPTQVTLLNIIGQGAASNQRVGKRVALKSLQIRGAVFSSGGTVYEDAAVVVVYDKMPCGTMPVKTDIFTTGDTYGFINDQNSDRFVILKRFDYNLTGNVSGNIDGANSNSIVSCDFYLPLKGLPTVYKALGTGAIGDISTGALYLMFVGKNPAASGSSSATVSCRVRFYDV